MLRCPCKNCADRVLKCHTHCGRYKTYQKELIEVKKDLKNAVEIAKTMNKYSG